MSTGCWDSTARDARAVDQRTGRAAGRPPHLVQLGAFLRCRRERLGTAAVGLITERRRTPGLRRGDVAHLANISVAWYERIEQGRDVRVSPGALHAIADALRLDVAERDYVFRLARVTGPGDSRPSNAAPVIQAVDLLPSPEAPDGTPPALRRLLDGFVVTSALLIDRYWDVVGQNQALGALLPDLAPVRTRPGVPPRNLVRSVLHAREDLPQTDGWEQFARACVGGLRASLAAVWAERPDDPHAAALIGALAHDSPEFRAWWPEHRVWAADAALRRVYGHPRVGCITVEVTFCDVRAAPGVTLVTYTPADQDSAAKLKQLTLKQTGQPQT